jgi:hypothetical protein
LIKPYQPRVNLGFNLTYSTKKMDITLTFTVQKTISIDNIPDYVFTSNEIENKIDELMVEHCPKDFDEVLESDYYWSGASSCPHPKGCEPIPNEKCWVEIDGQRWATNGIASVTPDCPPINDCNYLQPWYENDGKLEKALRENLFDKFKLPSKLHQGYFAEQFLPLKSVGNLSVYGDGIHDPAWCYVGEKLIAVLMPVQVRNKDEIEFREYFKFN